MKLTAPVPTLGRIVHYAVTKEQADVINERRKAHYRSLRKPNTEAGQFVRGSQSHTGNPVEAGQVFPGMIVAVWGTSPESCVNLQVVLDGSDTLWATSANVTKEITGKPEAGSFAWPNLLPVVQEAPVKSTPKGSVMKSVKD